MTTDRRVGRIGRRQAAVAATLMALVGGACADEADGPDAATGAEVGDFAATSEYLAGVAEATDGLSYRMSMDMTMAFSFEGEGSEVGGTLLTGEVDGDTSSMTMDMGELFGDVPGAGLPEGGLTMEMVTDGTTLYLRAPYFTTMAEEMLAQGATRADLGPLGDLAALGDEWGSIDLAQISPSEVASAAGAQSTDPRAYLDMAARGTDVHELGDETIDGVDTRGLGATITYGDLIEAQGQDADDVREQMAAAAGAGAGPGGEEFAEIYDQLLEGMFAMDVPVEVWVDGDDRVRRIEVDLDMTGLMAGMAEAAGEDAGDAGMSAEMVMDFTDYGDESIDIDIPEASQDITDEYRALIDGGGLGSGIGGSPLGSS
jgi:hypothetical protein